MLETAERFQFESYQHDQVRLGDAVSELIEACQQKDGELLNQSMGKFLITARDEMARNCFNVSDPAKVSAPTLVAPSTLHIHSCLPMDEPEFVEIVADFVPQVHGKLKEMRDRLEGEDMDELAKLAHWLKGAGGTCGFNEFYEPALQLERAAKGKDAASAERCMRELMDLANRIYVPQIN